MPLHSGINVLGDLYLDGNQGRTNLAIELKVTLQSFKLFEVPPLVVDLQHRFDLSTLDGLIFLYFIANDDSHEIILDLS